MIVITRAQMKFLTRGRVLSVAAGGRYRKGRDYAVTTPGRRTAVCRAEVIDLTDDGQIRIRIAVGSDRPRLLAAYSEYGYTDNPGQAMHGEGEAVGPDDLARFAAEAAGRFAVQRADELVLKRARSIRIRLKDAERRGDRGAFKALGAELSGL